jgi:uncharacterized protein (DUF924 family)
MSHKKMTKDTASTPDEVISFWLDEVGPSGWYVSNDAVDSDIRHRFLSLWEQARGGELEHWQASAERALAFLILTDQFPRNMFRGDARSFEADPMARACCLDAIEQGLDQHIETPARQFFYMPLMHSELMSDQNQSVECFKTKMGGDNSNVLHAQVHRAVIEEFGRFPYRNDALGRTSTLEEVKFIENGGYGFALRRFQGA